VQKKTLLKFLINKWTTSFILHYSCHCLFIFWFLLRVCEKRDMGNCQAVDAAALVIQHPSGKIERLYWPVSASEVMRTNPGHYVSLIIPLAVPPDQGQINQEQKAVLFTRVKLLRPNETLTLGHAYRLVTTQGILVCLLLHSRCDFSCLVRN